MSAAIVRADMLALNDDGDEFVLRAGRYRLADTSNDGIGYLAGAADGETYTVNLDDPNITVEEAGYDGTHDRRLIQRMQGLVVHLANLSENAIDRQSDGAIRDELIMMQNEAQSVLRALEKEHPE